MRLLDKLLGRDRPAAEVVQGDEPPAEVLAGAQENTPGGLSVGTPEDAAPPEPKPPA
jgi:hypothetical protein